MSARHDKRQGKGPVTATRHYTIDSKGALHRATETSDGPINLQALPALAPCFVADVIGALLTPSRVHRFHSIGQDRLYGPHGSVRSVERQARKLEDILARQGRCALAEAGWEGWLK